MRAPASFLVLLPAIALAQNATRDDRSRFFLKDEIRASFTRSFPDLLIGERPGILSSRHNLSASGPGKVKAVSETQVCIFCHVPHRGNLLNRRTSDAEYLPYSSTTLYSDPPGAPNGASRMCLSCHDGTIALGQTLASGYIQFFNVGPGGAIPPGPSNLGTDLRRTHPISFVPAQAPTLRAPPIEDPVGLDSRGRLQCTSCHDPHSNEADPVQGKFLVKPNRASALCLTCHVVPYWATNPSSHQSSITRFDESRGAKTPYATVADNGCESCHTSHGAATTSRLIRDTPSGVCMACHGGQVAKTDLAADFAKPSAHPALGGDSSTHDAAEGPDNLFFSLPERRSSSARHAECVDCHNPHASFAQEKSAPLVRGALAGVWGINRNGERVDPAQFEYEICFKCHGDSANQARRPDIAMVETVLRPTSSAKESFDLSAVSSHPVEGPGRNPWVPGLIPPLTSQSVIYCTDCHSSDNGKGAGHTGPQGPHGSRFPHLLERQLVTSDRTVESPDAYALCYKCHDRNTLFSDESGFPLHRTHVQQDGAPCSACHDWHGISALQGNPVNNAHLMNFDLAIVSPGPQGVLRYTSVGLRHGTCELTCHETPHVKASY